MFIMCIVTIIIIIIIIIVLIIIIIIIIIISSSSSSSSSSSNTSSSGQLEVSSSACPSSYTAQPPRGGVHESLFTSVFVYNASSQSVDDDVCDAVENNIVECRPPLGALPLSPSKSTLILASRSLESVDSIQVCTQPVMGHNGLFLTTDYNSCFLVSL